MNQECWCVHVAVAVYRFKENSIKMPPVFAAGNDVKDLFADAKSGDRYRVLKIILEDGKQCPVSSPEADDGPSTWLPRLKLLSLVLQSSCVWAPSRNRHEHGTKSLIALYCPSLRIKFPATYCTGWTPPTNRATSGSSWPGRRIAPL